ncbi:MAG: BON domain-containing protein [Betaproteobacteria bacterium]
MKTLFSILAAALIALPAYGQSKTDDAAIDAKVRGAMAADVGLKTLRINVDVDKGVVTLKGKVDSDETRRKAAEVARKVNGVKSVNNELQVEKKG